MSTSQNCCFQCLCPHHEPQLSPTSVGDPPILAGRSGPVFYGVTAFFPGSWCTQYFLCALEEWNFCFLQSCGSPAIKSCWLSKLDSLGTPPSVARPPGWEA